MIKTKDDYLRIFLNIRKNINFKKLTLCTKKSILINQNYEFFKHHQKLLNPGEVILTRDDFHEKI